MILRSLAVIGAGGLVLAGVLYVASTVDARPPEVLEIGLTQPLADDPRTALITTSLEVVFSEPVEPSSAVEALELEPDVDGAVSWSGSTMIFTPAEPLRLETAYRVRIGDGVRDLSGNEMAELPPAFEFATSGRPTLVEAVPEDGATDVPLDEPIGLTFSRLMDTSSVEAELRLRPAFPHELRWSGELLEIVPTDPLRPGAEYEVSLQSEAADVAGVTLGEPISFTFRTVAPGLAVEALMPADGIDGIALVSPIAVIFDRPVDSGSISDDLLTITPELAGTLAVARLPDDPQAEGEAGSVLQFVPSAPLPPNTTFDVELRSGVTSTAGGGLAGPIEWSFTTGAPVSAVSNQITFLTDRAGVTNVWAMNRDGTGERQLSAELAPVLSYAVAPDGGSLVLSNGRGLVFQRADGSDRRLLTEEGFLDFDPAYAPNSQRIAFARADAATGAGLGVWEWEVGGGEPTPIVLPTEGGEASGPSGSGGEAPTLRAPRYSPDGATLAFVDLAGSVAFLELPTERLTRIDFHAAAPPHWLPGSQGVLVTGSRTRMSAPEPFEAPVGPMMPDEDDEVARLSRSGSSVNATPFGAGSQVVAISAEGRIAYVDAGGSLYLADLPNAAPRQPVIGDARVIDAAFAPGEPGMVVVIGDEASTGQLAVLDIGTGRRTVLAAEGGEPRWVP